MGLFDIFTNQQPQTQQPQTQQPQTQPPEQPKPPTPGNIPEPSDSSIQAQPNEGTLPKQEDSPLASYKDLWEPINNENQGQTSSSPPAVTPEAVSKAVDNANFANAITEAQLQAISNGGEEAQKAFSEALNQVAKQVMVQSTLVNNKLTEKAVAAALEQQNASIPELLRKQQSTAHLNDTDPLLKNPAIKPVVEATQSQLLQKYPNASPAEITQMTTDYIKAMGEAFSPKQIKSDPNEVDWEKFLTAS